MFQRTLLMVLLVVGLAASSLPRSRAGDEAAAAKQQLDTLGVQRGLCMLFGDKAALAVPLARQTELTIFVQSPDAKQVDALRRQADAAGLLGTRIYIHHDGYQRLHLADNLVDAILLDEKIAGAGGITQTELQRVLRPEGKILSGGAVRSKPTPSDTDAWTHPYHAPDNNPQSNDLTARRPFLTRSEERRVGKEC